MRFHGFFLLFGLVAFSSACGPSSQGDPLENETIQIHPVSAAEKAVIRLALETGLNIPVESAILPPSSDAATECSQFKSALPPSIQKGFITVPEDWSNPSGRKIKVFYYAQITKKRDGTTNQPVVFFNGGPGGNSHSSYSILDQQNGAKNLSFVYIDQRGTGCSDPFPITPISLETARRLKLYGSRSIVKDAEAVRVQLFGATSKWHAFGQSYGGYIVHRYAEIAPANLSGAFAHGSSVMTDTVEWLLARIRSQHRVIEDYFKTYPEDREKLARLHSLIPKTRCFESDGTRACGAIVLDAATVLLGFQTSWPTLHHWIGSILKQDGTLDSTALTTFVRQYVFGVYASNGFAASVISKLELVPGMNDAQGCTEVLSRLEAAGEGPLKWAVNECRLLASMKNKWDEVVLALPANDGVSIESFMDSLTRNPNLHFFLYSGQKDVFVPAETFQEEADKLGNRITYVNFQNSGHEGFYTERQIWNDLQTH